MIWLIGAPAYSNEVLYSAMSEDCVKFIMPRRYKQSDQPKVCWQHSTIVSVLVLYTDGAISKPTSYKHARTVIFLVTCFILDNNRLHLAGSVHSKIIVSTQHWIIQPGLLVTWSQCDYLYSFSLYSSAKLKEYCIFLLGPNNSLDQERYRHGLYGNVDDIT